MSSIQGSAAPPSRTTSSVHAAHTLPQHALLHNKEQSRNPLGPEASREVKLRRKVLTDMALWGSATHPFTENMDTRYDQIQKGIIWPSTLGELGHGMPCEGYG
jgi:hypothetical protein